MATDRLINQSQGDDIIDALDDIATSLGNISYGEQTSSDKVVAMTGYQKASTAEAITQADTLNEAVGKLEKKVDDNATDISDKVDGPNSATVGNIATFNNVDGKSINDSGISVETSLDNTKDTEVPTSKAVDTYITDQGFAKGVSSSTANNLVAFNGTDGKTLKDSGITVAKSVTNDDTTVPTSKAVQTYAAPASHTHSESEITDLGDYAGSNEKGGAAKSANKLNIGSSNIGSATQPVYFDKTTGLPVAITNTIQSNVPANAVFTDTTYQFDTGTANGKIKVSPSDDAAYEVPVYGLKAGAYAETTTSVTSGSGALITSGGVHTVLSGKVDKVTGKGLSSNDYTDDEKSKLSNIQAGAEVNVQADWTQTTTTADSYIKNKPTLGTAAAANTTDFATAAQGTKADNAIPSSTKGVANGVASLDANGKVPSSQLPSYVDDVLEYSSKSSFPSSGESGKIYVDTSTNKTYRWGGSAYVEISESIALGETENTAYYGNKGKTAYDHATDSSRVTSATASGLYKVAATAQGHIASLSAVTKADITGLGIPGTDTNTYVSGAQFADNTSADANNPLKLTLSRSGSVTTAVTGTLPKVSSSTAGVAPKGAAVSSQSQSTKFLREDGTWAKPSYTTNTNTTYTFASGTTNGAFSVTPSGGSVQSVSIYGLKSAAYTESSAYASSSHTHTKSQITDFPTSMTPTSHTHGNIQNAGTLQTNDITIASGDKLVVTDSSDSSKIARASISFDGSTTTQALTKAGTWATFGTSNLVIGTGASQAAAGNHVHNLSIDASTASSASINLAANSIYTLTAGGKTYTFKTPADNNSVTGVKGNAENSYRTGQVNITPANIGAVPTSTTVNSKALSGNITLSASDVGAAASDHVHTLTIAGAASGATANVNLSANTIYTLTAGGKTYNFKTPADNNSNTIACAYCETGASIADKTAACTNYALLDKSYLIVTIKTANSSASALTLNVNGKGAKTIYINGSVSSSSNYTLPAGTYIVYYSTYYYFRTDGKITTTGMVDKNGNTTKYFRGDGSLATPTASDVGAVPTSRTVNNKALSGNITLSASDVGAASSGHVHGSINSNGTLNTSPVGISNGDRMLITCASNDNLICTGVEFDGSTTTKALTKAGTWATFNNYSLPTASGSQLGGVKIGSNISNSSGTISLSFNNVKDALGYTPVKEVDGITGEVITRHGFCNTAAATAAKTVSIANGAFTLDTGARVTVNFIYANTADNPTLNVNSKGAKYIYSKGSKITNGSNKSLLAGTVDFVYDGTQWNLVGNYTTYTHPTDGTNTGSFGPSASTSPGFGETFSVPYVTVNNKGHVTAASSKTITMPNFTATPYTQPTKHSNITSIDSGGYIQIGKLVIVNMRFTVGTACGQYTDIFTDLPLPLTPLSGGYGVVACSSNTDQAFAICANGRLQNYSGTLSTASYVVSACYIGQ